MHRAIRHSAPLVLLACVLDTDAMAEPAVPSQQEVVAWLAHQESLVGSAEIEYACVVPATSDEETSLIRLFFEQRGTPNDADRFIDRRGGQYAARFWRSGIKERSERWGPNGTSRTLTAYDGTLVRVLQADGDAQRQGYLHTANGAHFYDTNRRHPFSFLYEYCGRPWSEVFAEATDYRASIAEGADRIVVHGRREQMPGEFQLEFDSHRRLVARSMVMAWSPSEPDVFPREVHTFSDYREFPHASGESIWFPMRADYSYRRRRVDDGRLVVWCSETYTVKEIEFNKPLDDNLFTIEFDDDTPVFDDVTGLGNLPAKELSSATQRRGVRATIWWSIGAIVLVLVCSAVVRSRLARRREPPA